MEFSKPRRRQRRLLINENVANKWVGDNSFARAINILMHFSAVGALQDSNTKYADLVLSGERATRTTLRMSFYIFSNKID